MMHDMQWRGAGSFGDGGGSGNGGWANPRQDYTLQDTNAPILGNANMPRQMDQGGEVNPADAERMRSIMADMAGRRGRNMPQAMY
jgi:hypothetical protein